MLGRWFDEYGSRLVLYARQWLPAGAAEDAVQEVFVRLLRQGRPPRSVSGWLFRSVRNAAMSELRSSRRRRRREQRRADERSEWFESGTADLIDAAAAQAAIKSLEQAQREVIVMRIWGELTLQEIAEVVGSPVSTVFSRYRAALAALRERMAAPCKAKKS